MRRGLLLVTLVALAVAVVVVSAKKHDHHDDDHEDVFAAKQMQRFKDMSEEDVTALFQGFTVKHNKKYDGAEYVRRLGVFKVHTLERSRR